MLAIFSSMHIVVAQFEGKSKKDISHLLLREMSVITILSILNVLLDISVFVHFKPAHSKCSE